MTRAGGHRNRDRIKALVGVAAFHVLLGYGLIVGLGFDVPDQVTDPFKVFDVPQEQPPPPVEEIPSPEPEAKEEEGAASPPNIKSKPAPVVVPPPKVRLKVPPKVATSDRPSPAPPGKDATAGASNVAGPGTGSGGSGSGTGSGGSGTGPGGGGNGLGARAVRERGGFTQADYRKVAKGTPLNATVHVRFTVMPDGSVRGCLVTRSSGRPDVDATTCRLIEQRFRYRAARDRQGQAISETVNTVFSWEPR